MMCERVFVPLSVPFVRTVAERLVRETLAKGDLSDDVVVVPTAQAGRLLPVLLRAVGGGTSGEELQIPAIVTAADLPRLLVVLREPLATPLQSRLAVVTALRAADPELLAALTHAAVAPRDDLGRFVLAGEIARTFREIASFGRTAADVARAARGLPGLTSAARWEALAELETLQRRALEKSGLGHEPTVLREAAKNDAYWRPRRVIFVGTPDVAPALVELVAATRVPCLAFVQGDPADEARFDGYGMLLAARWEGARLALRDDQLFFAEGPREQGEIAAALISSTLLTNPAARVLVSSTDASDEPSLAARALSAGQTLRSARGRSISSSVPARALAAARDLLVRGTIESLSAFVRHPNVERILGRRGVPFAADKLDRSLSRSPSRAVLAALDRAEPELAVAVRELLAPLTERGKGGIPRFLGSLFGKLPPASADARAVASLVDVARGIAEAPTALRLSAGPAEALSVVLAGVEGESLPAVADEGALDLVGYLELPLADADVLVITGVGEGRWPARVAEDALLPEPLRRAAGLGDSTRAYARDAHAFQVATAGHREAFVIVPRTTSAGDALAVSRLVLADTPEVAARRLLAAYGRRPAMARRGRAGATTSGFRVPALPALTERPQTLSVTAFRDYLACPYRFALRHLFRLSAVETDPLELEPAAFGTLVHAVLQDFGTSAQRDSEDPAIIAEFCSERLSVHLARLTFDAPTAAALVQTEQARERLRSFAVAQAEHRRSGFRIERVELAVETPDALPGITLVGRIDRIDRHEDGRTLLLDYKTSDKARTPELSHRKRGEWTDLQLPLYRHLATAAGYSGPFLLGYASLPRERAGFALATWTEEELASADELAALIVEKILLDPLAAAPVSPPPPFSEIYSGICQDHALGDDDEEEEEAS